MSTPIDTDVFIRPLGLSDLDSLYVMLDKTGPGFTSLSTNKFKLKEKLSRVEASFANQNQPVDQLFLFGLITQVNNQLIGICGIKSNAGNHTPFYHYKVSKIVQTCRSLNKFKAYSVLSLVNDHQSAGELCSLFISPEHRKKYRGAFLSRARFLFIANYLSQFPDYFIAEMRGFCDSKGESPFWNSLLKPFFDMSFVEADFLTTAHNKQFIADLMPKYPIYTHLLSPEAQKVIGQVHPDTKHAIDFLYQEKFEYHHYVDIFDAGPTVEARTHHIHTIQNSHLVKVNAIKTNMPLGRWALISNVPPIEKKGDFLATVGEIYLDGDECQISKIAAERLKVDIGAPLRICDFL
jgi:arginine N-succinyltransferase